MPPKDAPGWGPVAHVALCPVSCTLAVAHARGRVLLYSFGSTRGPGEAPVVLARLPAPASVVPAAAAVSPPTSPLAAAAAPAPVKEECVAQLVAYGFAPEACRAALASCGGDVNLAAAQLFDRDMGLLDGESGTDGAAAAIASSSGPKARAGAAAAVLDALPASVFLPATVVAAEAEPGFQLRCVCHAATAAGAATVEEAAAVPVTDLCVSARAHLLALRGSGHSPPCIGTLLHSEPVTHVSCLRLCPAAGLLAFASQAGLVVVDVPTRRVRAALSLSQLYALRAEGFNARAPLTLQPTDEAVVALDFAPLPAAAVEAVLWAGTTGGDTFAITLPRDPALPARVSQPLGAAA